MHLLCAWCREEGKPGYLGMVEPLDNPVLTHGLCANHKEQLLESRPSRSFPDAEVKSQARWIIERATHSVAS